MNESIDLRKRILKMREDNNSILKTVKSEPINQYIKQEVKSEDVILENKEKSHSNFTKTKFVENTNTKEQSLLKKEINSQIQTVSQHSNKLNNMNLEHTNEVQFRILANKFNEAVEVILELSDKVKKIEHTIYKNDKNTKKGNSFFYYIKMKFLFSLILVPMLIIGVLSLPFDFFTIRLILSDIISSM